MYTWPDGTEFDGYFENDKKEGFGTFTFPSGNKFEVCTINQSVNQLHVKEKINTCPRIFFS